MSIGDKEARDLGMDRPIARRDIISGIAVAVAGTAAAKILPAAAAAPAGDSQVGAPAGAFPDYYPPKLTGLRGSYVGSFEQAHKARDGGFSPGTAAEDTKESYDLIVVGGGISGLSAAHFYRQMLGDNKRVLVI